MVDIVEEIRNLCFSQDIQNRKNLHSLLIDKLVTLFMRNNFRVVVESPVFHDHLTLKTGVVEGKQGYVDLLAIGQNQKIAIEFDSGTSLKFKSIEKLLQCDANILLGIVRGRSTSFNSETTLNHNRERILHACMQREK